jgi:four helix bundle protein
MNNKKTELKYRAYRFSLAVIEFVNTLPHQRVFWVIADQLLRAATSIGANIVEAQSASSKRDFVRFYEIALKSANETKYWLCLLRDAGILKETQAVEELLQEAIELSRILGSSLITLKGKRKF